MNSRTCILYCSLYLVLYPIRYDTRIERENRRRKGYFFLDLKTLWLAFLNRPLEAWIWIWQAWLDRDRVRQTVIMLSVGIWFLAVVASCLTSASGPKEIFTNQFYVELEKELPNSQVHSLAKRHGFVNLGPVSVYWLLLRIHELRTRWESEPTSFNNIFTLISSLHTTYWVTGSRVQHRISLLTQRVVTR